jgi:osmotically-inducible protein OsmY
MRSAQGCRQAARSCEQSKERSRVMANGDRWRNEQDWRNNQDWRSEQERYGSRNDDRDRSRSGDERWRDQGGRSDYGRGSEGGGDYRDFRESRGGGYEGGRQSEPGGGYGAESYGNAYRGGRDFGSGFGGDYGRGSGRDYGGGGSQNRYGGNDYMSGNYGADQGFGRGSRDYNPRGGNDRGFWDRASDEVSSWFGDDDAERRRREDQRGEHRGRGPKGYTRSDERIREDVSDRLSDDPFVDASDIEVSVSGCEVTLSGTVDNREAKRRAEDVAERVSGVKHVQNNLRVQQQGSGLMGSSGSMGGTSTGASGTSDAQTSGSNRKAGTSA